MKNTKFIAISLILSKTGNSDVIIKEAQNCSASL